MRLIAINHLTAPVKMYQTRYLLSRDLNADKWSTQILFSNTGHLMENMLKTEIS